MEGEGLDWWSTSRSTLRAGGLSLPAYLQRDQGVILRLIKCKVRIACSVIQLIIETLMVHIYRGIFGQMDVTPGRVSWYMIYRCYFF